MEGLKGLIEMNSYKALKTQKFTNGEYSIVPIRKEDRYLIMKWRNEQLYHLRQSQPLTKEDQDLYFENVVFKLFDQEKPDQILFSYLEKDQCIGYGGLVHLKWEDQNAELSFIMNTELEVMQFGFHWSKFLKLIEKVAFEEVNIYKIFTYAFDLRPQLYPILETEGFKKEAVLKGHCKVDGNFKDVIIHSKWRMK